MKKSSVPYYTLAGESSTEIPGSATLRDVGGKVIIGKYYVVHRNNDGDERYPWVVYEKMAVGANPAHSGQTSTDVDLDHAEVDTYPQYRDAVRAAKRLDRLHLASQKTGGEETKAA